MVIVGIFLCEVFSPVFVIEHAETFFLVVLDDSLSIYLSGVVEPNLFPMFLPVFVGSPLSNLLSEPNDIGPSELSL